MKNETSNNEWVIADEAQPEKIECPQIAPEDVYYSVDVLCLLENGDFEVGYYVYPHRFSGCGGWLCNGEAADVTHWMPLPALPQL